MRTYDIPITITIPFPYNKPDGNGVVYDKKAVKESLKQDVKGMPIHFVGEDGNRVVIGHITTNFIPARWDDNEGVCRAITQGVIYSGGTDCYAEFHKDNKTVKSIEFTSLGFSLPDKEKD